MADPDLRALLESWTIHLRAERKAEGTIWLYATGVRAFLTWCAGKPGRPRSTVPLSLPSLRSC
jgi:hypothetical protein